MSHTSHKAATGCFNCRFNRGEHPQYKIGKKYEFYCDAVEGHHGRSEMAVENPTKPLCKHWQVQFH